MVSSVFSTCAQKFLPSPHPIQTAIESGLAEDAIGALKLGDLLNKPLPNGELPLNYAIRHEKAAIVKKIFQELKPDIGMKDYQGLTCIDHAMLGGNPKMQALVLGCVFGNSFESCIQQLNQGSTEIFATELHSEMHKVRQLNMSQTSEMHLAARVGDVSKMESLLASGGDVNQGDGNGLTPLHYACLFGSYEAVKFLLQKARSDLLASDRKSALHFAAIGGHSKVIELLLSSTKLSPNVRDAKQSSPLHYAALSNDPTGAALLIQRGANPLDKELGATPLALLMHHIQERSNLSDPLKLDKISMFMFASFVGSWLLQLSGNQKAAQALDVAVLVATIPMMIMQSVQNRGKHWSDALPMFFWTAAVNCFGTPSLKAFFSYASAATAVVSSLKGIQRSWRGLTYETYRPLRNAVVYSFNGASSVYTCFSRVENILKQAKKENCPDGEHAWGNYYYHWDEEAGYCDWKQDYAKAEEACRNRGSSWKWNEDFRTCDQDWDQDWDWSKFKHNSYGNSVNYKYGSADPCTIGDWQQNGDCIIKAGENLHNEQTAYRSDAAKVLGLKDGLTKEECKKQSRKLFGQRGLKYHPDKCSSPWCDQVYKILSVATSVACDEEKYRYSTVEL